MGLVNGQPSRFNSRIDAGRSRLVLTRPDHSQTALPSEAEDAGNRLRSAADLAAPGAYSLRWQVLAIDGHITRGDIPFRVTAFNARRFLGSLLKDAKKRLISSFEIFCFIIFPDRLRTLT